jgi:hypothetical protein
MLGFGGHFLTKARRYSVTFTELRGDRTAYRQAGNAVEAAPVRSLSYVGSGWLSEGDAALAQTAARQRRRRQRIGREELAHEAWSAGAAA